jgi:hypothetical protein
MGEIVTVGILEIVDPFDADRFSSLRFDREGWRVVH